MKSEDRALDMEIHTMMDMVDELSLLMGEDTISHGT